MNSSGKRSTVYVGQSSYNKNGNLLQDYRFIIYRVLLLFSTPVFSSQTFVAVVTPFSVFFGSFE